MNKHQLKKELTRQGLKIVKGNYIRHADIDKYIVAHTKQKTKEYLKEQLRSLGIMVRGEYVRKKDIDYLLLQEAAVWDNLKNFIKSATKKAIAAILALGLLAGTAMGKDISKKTDDLTKSMNKIYMNSGTGVKVHCKGKDLGGKNFKLTCTWTDSNSKTLGVDWVYQGEDEQNVELVGDESSDAAPFAKEFFEALEGQAMESMR